MTGLLEQFDKDQRKAIVKAAGRLYRSGAEPSEGAAPAQPTRAQRRQAARAFGWRGSKTARHNTVKRTSEIMRVVAIDEALGAAKDRIEHPVRSRLRRR